MELNKTAPNLSWVFADPAEDELRWMPYSSR